MIDAGNSQFPRPPAVGGGDPLAAIAGMDPARREEVAASTEALGAALYALRALPYGQRRGRLLAQRARLVAQGVPAVAIDTADPTDASIDASVAMALRIRQAVADARRGGGPQGPEQRPAPPPRAIAALRRDPRLAAQFDDKYGQGLAARVLGRL